VIAGADLEIFERSISQATSRQTGAALDAALTELGWQDALEVDPATAISTLFALQGRANATSTALDHVVASGLGVEVGATSAVVLPALGAWTPPGNWTGAGLIVSGVRTGAEDRADTALVVSLTPDPGTVNIATVEVSALASRPVHGLDPAFGLAEVRADSPAYSTTVVERPAGSWSRSVALAQLAVGYELVGAARAMLDQAREHALNRVQFGQTISHFQAVRHRLADTLVAIESAEAVLDAAGESGSVELAATGKALAGKGARTAARHCQQVLAGIGFTAEHPFHRYLRRVLVLDQLFGTARALTETLGNEVLAGRRLPDLLPL
jgi:hypothetical protein